jgi:hypothetical protein
LTPKTPSFSSKSLHTITIPPSASRVCRGKRLLDRCT